MENQFVMFSSEEDLIDADGKYTKKISIPQYLPSKYPPKLFELMDSNKYHTLLSNIAVANISDDEKEFLRLAASRHIIFNYGKIADYYAHATPEMQRLMEQSALVIIDIDDAIANGYVKLSSDIRKLISEGNL